jgi:hypothetical protein
MVIKRRGFGSARKFLGGRTMLIDRYLQTYYPPEDWHGVRLFFKMNPIQARHIINDFAKTNEAKLEKVVQIFVSGKSKIVFIVGARGGGKTATAFMFAESIHYQTSRPIFYVSSMINKKAMPNWMRTCDNLQQVPRGSFAIIDESAIQFNSRRSMEKGNKQLGEELAIARHRELFLVFITQHMAMTDTNIDRLKDLVIWKQANDYSFGVRGNQTREGKFWDKVRNMMSPRDKPECLFEYPAQRRFIHFSHGLPDCWSDALSRTWQDANLTKKQEAEKPTINPNNQPKRRKVTI